MALPRTTKRAIVGAFLFVAGCAAPAAAVKPETTQPDPRVEQAQRDLQDSYTALKVFFVKTGAWPTSAQGFDALVQANLIERVPLDPWGAPFGYALEDGWPSVRSAGPDGQQGTADDLGGPLPRSH